MDFQADEIVVEELTPRQQIDHINLNPTLMQNVYHFMMDKNIPSSFLTMQEITRAIILACFYATVVHLIPSHLQHISHTLPVF